MKKNIEQKESVFRHLNLNNKREDNELKEDYKIRIKRNKYILKLYMKLGLEVFNQVFPEGVTNNSFQSVIEDNIK